MLARVPGLRGITTFLYGGQAHSVHIGRLWTGTSCFVYLLVCNHVCFHLSCDRQHVCPGPQLQRCYLGNLVLVGLLAGFAMP